MASVVYANDVNILIDPAASLAPRRFSLKPHPIEIKRLEEVSSKICEIARDVDVIVITHYHYDHHDPGRYIPVDIYDGKDVIIKNPHSKINVSQRIRAFRFIKLIKDRARNVVVGDGKEFTFGMTKMIFSDPVPHGANSRLGYVIEVLIDDGDYKIIHTSDVEGFVTDEAVRFILNNRPDLAVIDGPPIYLLGHHFNQEDLLMSIHNLARVASALGNAVIILDHHLLRDLNYKEFYDSVIKHLPITTKVRIMCAAEYMGVEPLLLEARRRELYGMENGGYEYS